jgi:hypothetical protein
VPVRVLPAKEKTGRYARPVFSSLGCVQTLFSASLDGEGNRGGPFFRKQRPRLFTVLLRKHALLYRAGFEGGLFLLQDHSEFAC